MTFPASVKDESLVACGRHCCICHRFCGIKIEIHHIKPKASGGPNTFENAIPLCFDCHADMRTYDSKHPKGTKYSEFELKTFRDNWYEKIKNSNGIVFVNSVETDKEIYRKLLEVLPWNGSLAFISENNFAGYSFRRDDLKQLTDFQYLCDNPAFEFIDADLESLKAELLNKVKIFLRLIAYNTFPTHIMGLSHVPPEWETNSPQHFDKVVDDIHQAAQSIIDTYQQLMRMGTRKLGTLPMFA